MRVNPTMLTRLAQTHDLVPKQFLCTSDWFMHSELGYFACSLASGVDDGAMTLKTLFNIVEDQLKKF